MKQSRRHLYFILFVILLEIIGIGIIIPIFPKLLMQLGDVNLSDAARVGGYLVFVYAIMQFIFGPIMGGLSDQFGRRPVIMISLVIICLDYILLSWAPSIWWLVVGRIIGGIAGSTITAAHAYIADISDKENRAKYFGFLGASIGLGFILGPAMGGYLGEIDVRLPFKIAAILIAATLVFSFFLLPESLAMDNRRKFEFKRASPIGTLFAIAKYKWVIGLLSVFLCLEMAGQVYPSIWTYFTIESFGWGSKQVGVSLMVYGMSMVIVQGALIGPIIKKIGIIKAVFVGFGATFFGLLGVGLIQQSWMLYSLMPIMVFGGLATVGIRTLMSQQTPENAQGELQGAIASVMSIVAFVSPLMMTQIFGYFTSSEAYIYLPGAPFFAASIFGIIAVLLFTNGIKKIKKNDQVNDFKMVDLK